MPRGHHAPLGGPAPGRAGLPGPPSPGLACSTCSVRLRASCVCASSKALASSSVLSFSSWSLCSSSCDETQCHGVRGGARGRASDGAGRGRTFISDSRFTCSIWKASCSFTRATSSWLCCVTVSCLAVSAFCGRTQAQRWPGERDGEAGARAGGHLAFLSSSACAFTSSPCFSLSLL